MAYRNLIALLIWGLFIGFKPVQVFSQTKKIDSLKLLLAHAKEDTSKLSILFEINKVFFKNHEFDSALNYANSALNSAKKLKKTPEEFKALICLGNATRRMHNYSEGLKYFNKALILSQGIGSKIMMAESYDGIGRSYTFLDKFPEAFQNSFIALKLYEETGDKCRIAKTWETIGSIYSIQGNQQEIENCYGKALQLFEECPDKEKEDIAQCYHFIGRANLLMGHYKKALNLFTAALQIWQATNNRSYIAGTISHFGLVYKGLGDSAFAKADKITAKKMYNNSLKNFLKSLTLWEALKDTESVALSNINLGNINIALHKLPLARYHLKKASQLATIERSNNTYRKIYESLSRLDSAKGNFKLAFENHKLSVVYKDNFLNGDIVKKSEEYKMQYEFNKIEDSLKQKQIITETKLNAEKNQKYFYWAGLSLLALLAFSGYLNFKNQKKINRLAAEAYASERTELELQSLRAQLNPHFIFNCINSIDAFIHSNDKYNATIYLNKFARLLRNILDSSKLTSVPFAKDIDTLKLYIELEELRHENKFKTAFNIDDELLSNDYKVPALIIQPFVENAILHGLKNREDNEGLLQIEIKKLNDKIEYTIKDNGIGRKAAGTIAQNKEASYGMQMSNDRVKLFNKEEKPSVQIIDLYKDDIATGTEVKVCLNIL